jgi:hypothetical protein
LVKKRLACQCRSVSAAAPNVPLCPVLLVAARFCYVRSCSRVRLPLTEVAQLLARVVSTARRRFAVPCCAAHANRRCDRCRCAAAAAMEHKTVLVRRVPRCWRGAPCAVTWLRVRRRRAFLLGVLPAVPRALRSSQPRSPVVAVAPRAAAELQSRSACMTGRQCSAATPARRVPTPAARTRHLSDANVLGRCSRRSPAPARR